MERVFVRVIVCVEVKDDIRTCMHATDTRHWKSTAQVRATRSPTNRHAASVFNPKHQVVVKYKRINTRKQNCFYGMGNRSNGKIRDVLAVEGVGL